MQPDMAGRELNSVLPRSEALSLLRICKAQVERRALDDRTTRRGDGLLSPRSGPPLLDLRRKPCLDCKGDALAEQCPEHAMHQPAGTTIDQRKSGGDQRVIWDLQGDLLRQRKTQDHPRLGIVRKPLPRRTIDQLVEVGEAPQCLSRYSERQRLVVRDDFLGRGIQRLAPPEHRIQEPKRGAPGAEAFHAWLCGFQRPSPGR